MWRKAAGSFDVAANLYMKYQWANYNAFANPPCAAGETAVFKTFASHYDNPSQFGGSTVWQTLCAKGAGAVAPNL